MLANRLKILLAERDLTIKDTVNKTKISRNTLSNIVNNPYANISTTNINKLCNFLGVLPKDFYDYFPWDFSMGYAPRDRFLKLKKDKTPVGNFLIRAKSGSEMLDTGFYILLSVNNDESVIYDNDIELSIQNPTNERFSSLYQKMSPLFQHGLRDTIADMMVEFLPALNAEYKLTTLLNKNLFDVSVTLKGISNVNSNGTLEQNTLLNMQFLYDAKEEAVVNN